MLNKLKYFIQQSTAYYFFHVHETFPLEQLSKDLIISIFSFLSHTELGRLARVSSKIKVLAEEPRLWRELFLKKIECSKELYEMKIDKNFCQYLLSEKIEVVRIQGRINLSEDITTVRWLGIKKVSVVNLDSITNNVVERLVDLIKQVPLESSDRLSSFDFIFEYFGSYHNRVNILKGKTKSDCLLDIGEIFDKGKAESLKN